MRRCWPVVGLSISLCALGCGGSGSGTEEPGGGTGASSGSGGSGAVGGAGGSSSDGGGSGGDGGDSATGGTGGDYSTGGSGGITDDGSTGGTAGSAGDSSTGGSGGDSGTQDSSTGGTGGSPDAGDDGAAGSGGGWPTQCSTCHGSTANPAPPMDINGNFETSFAGVGSHQSHIAPSSWHREVPCNECHVVPTTPYDPAVPTHMNGEDDITWGPLAQQGTYDPTGLGCSSTYCHGATLDPDKAGTTSVRTPLWTTVDGSQKACGTSCHTLPPGVPTPRSAYARPATTRSSLRSWRETHPR